MTQRGRTQHASTISEHAVIVRELCTGVEHLRTVNLFQRQAVDLIPGIVATRIATRSNHHT